jgi:hypothetical protein
VHPLRLRVPTISSLFDSSLGIWHVPTRVCDSVRVANPNSVTSNEIVPAVILSTEVLKVITSVNQTRDTKELRYSVS